MIDKRLFKIAKNYKSSLIGTILTGVLSGVFILAQAYIISYIVNQVFFKGQGFTTLAPFLIGLLAIIIIRAILNYLEENYSLKLSCSIQRHLREAILEKTKRMGSVNLNQEKEGEIINLATEGVNILESYFSKYLPQLFKTAIIPILFLFWVFPLDFISGIILLLTAPLVPMFMMLIGKWTKKVTAKSWRILARMSGYLQDVLQGLETLKLLSQEEIQREHIKKISDDFSKTNMQVLRVAFLSALTLELITTLSIALVAVGLGVRLVEGNINFQAALFIILIAPEFYQPLRNLGVQFHNCLNGIEAANGIFAFLNLPEEKTAENPMPIKLNAGAEITFKNVTFAYSNDQEKEIPNALENISLTFPKNQITALVGESGGGKSTIIKLISKVLTNDQGGIFVDNSPLNQYSNEEWRKNISIIPQNPHLFSCSIIDNIKIANPNASKDEIITICKKIGADDFISTLPNSYETKIGNGGTKLSGGESQLISIARAYLKNAPIILCDEPTQSLDLISENKVCLALNELFQNKTVIVVAHRLQTIKNADKICVIKDGKLLEEGNYQELQKENTYFSSLLNQRGWENC